MYFSGRVHSVVYENPSQAFYILKMVLDKPKDGLGILPSATPDKVSVKGTIPGIAVRVGSWFGFEGEWSNHDKFGPQLTISKAPVLDVGGWDSDTAYRVLIANGVGDRVLASVREHHGDAFLDALQDVSLLKQVPGIDEFNAMHINQRWASVRTHFQTLIFLGDLGIPSGKIRQIWEMFGSEAEQVLTKNPWVILNIEGIPFSVADEIGLRLGLPLDHKGRIEGAITAAIRGQRNSGHLYMRTAHLVNEVQQGIPGTDPKTVGNALRDCHENKTVVLDRETQPGLMAVYDPWAWKIESESARLLASRVASAEFKKKTGIDPKGYISRLASVGPKTRDVALKKGSKLLKVVKTAVDEWGDTAHLVLSEAQKQGVINALTEPVSVLSGLPGTGKCVTPDTLVSGPWGVSPIGEIGDSSLAEGFHPLDLLLDTPDGIRQGSHLYNGGLSRVVRITTKSGHTIAGTPEHPIQVVEQGVFRWKTLGDISRGDVPVLVLGGMSFGSDEGMPLPSSVKTNGKYYHFPQRMTEDIAGILGYFVSEGSVTSDSCWTITNHDPCVLDWLMGAFQRSFGYSPSKQFDKRVGKIVGVRVGSRQIIRWFRKLGVSPVLSYQKDIPHRVLTASKNSIRAFLRSLFEGDGGYLRRDQSVEYGTSSLVLARQIQTVLLGFGIVAILHSRKTLGRVGYRISVRGLDYEKFRKEIGFQFTELSESTRKRNTNIHVIYKADCLVRSIVGGKHPRKGKEYNRIYRYSLSDGQNARKPSRERARLIASESPGTPAADALLKLTSDQFFYSPVADIVEEFSQVWDFQVPEGHCFLSNGFISHNTTSLYAVVRILRDAGVPFLLCAPTGIAAKRLSSLTNAPAYTIHRAFQAKGSSDDKRESTYIGIVGDSDGSGAGDMGEDENWGHDAEHPHPAEVVIVDESSMVDQHLVYRLLTCTSPQCRLVFVGDAAQLPPVGPGNVMRDMVDCGLFPTVRLTEIFRQKDTSDIVYAAHAIHHGEFPESQRDFKLVEVQNDDQASDIILKLAEKLYEKRANFQVLSPKHAGTIGVTSLNNKLRELLNPPSPGHKEIKLGSDVIREDDRIMVVQNNYKLGVYNGDVGKVSRIDTKAKEVEVKIFGDPPLLIRIEFKEVPDLIRLAYACTVHKSQGLEYDCIIMPLMDSFRGQLQRNLLYTAVTRAKHRVFLVGTKTALVAAVRNDKEDQRNTLFRLRLGNLIK